MGDRLGLPCLGTPGAVDFLANPQLPSVASMANPLGGPGRGSSLGSETHPAFIYSHWRRIHAWNTLQDCPDHSSTHKAQDHLGRQEHRPQLKDQTVALLGHVHIFLFFNINSRNREKDTDSGNEKFQTSPWHLVQRSHHQWRGAKQDSESHCVVSHDEHPFGTPYHVFSWAIINRVSVAVLCVLVGFDAWVNLYPCHRL